ncbi:MAG: HD domain-containing protein [Streptococcaceae bacterium]|jgi:uncharacterized protein|nr:HD domain-containing protein [Streptococcaceae bacterium]
MTDLEKIADFARNIHAQNNDGHGIDHIERVVNLAKKILATEVNANAELVLISCYLHDTYDEKLTPDVAKQKAIVRDFLLSFDFSDELFVNEIFYIIDHMSFSTNLNKKQFLSLEGQIVQDADRLDAMGAWGIVRTLEYGWSHGRKLYQPDILPQNYSSKADYHAQTENTTINHFYEKLFLLEDLLNTTEAKRIGKERQLIMHKFVEAIEKEYIENK